MAEGLSREGVVNGSDAGGGSGGVLILDTLNRAAPGADENSPVDMGNLIAASKELQSLTGAILSL